MSTSTACQLETETSLASLAEVAASTAADLERQQRRLDGLTTAFESKRSTVTPTVYATMRAEIDQQMLITQAASQAVNVAEQQLLQARLADDRQTEAKAKELHVAVIDTTLANLSNEIAEVQRHLGKLPEKLGQLQQRHSALLAERVAITR